MEMRLGLRKTYRVQGTVQVSSLVKRRERPRKVARTYVANNAFRPDAYAKAFPFMFADSKASSRVELGAVSREYS